MVHKPPNHIGHGGKMTKADIVERIYKSTNTSKKDAADLLEEVFSILKNTLEAGEKIKIAGFGNFEVKQKNDRKGRNPQTGKEMTITARRILTFKPSILLKTRINKQKQ
jgi:integration host factor subunit alpha